MGSSRKRVSKILGAISPADAERLLVDWANLHDLPYPAELDDQCRILVKRNPQVFGPNALDWEWGQLTGFDLIDFRDLLRRMWTAPDRRSKDWYCFHLRAKFHDWKTTRDYWHTNPPVHVDEADSETNKGLWELLDQPPTITGFEAAMFHFQTSIADRAKYCGGQDCPAPYFIAIKRWQKYCSEKCAGPANREAKRNWWHEHKGKGSL